MAIYTEFHCQRNFIFDPSFKYVKNMKTLVCDYHLNDQAIFLHHQISVCSAHARMLASGYKNAFFRASRVRARDFSTPCTNSISLKTPR